MEKWSQVFISVTYARVAKMYIRAYTMHKERFITLLLHCNLSVLHGKLRNIDEHTCR